MARACHRSLDWRGLAYVFGRRTDEVFLQLKALLEPYGIRRFHTIIGGHRGATSNRTSTILASATCSELNGSI